MIKNLKKSFKAYSEKPFLYVWSSLLYIFLFLSFFFAAIGVFLTYFMIMSVFQQEFSLESLPTMGVIGILVVLLLFFLNGLNAALSRSYSNSTSGEKTSLAEFYKYAIQKGVPMFVIMLVRELFWALLVGPAIILYVYVLQGHQYMDILIGIYAAFMTFIVHMVFTPAFLSCGARGTDIYSSLRHCMRVWKKKHVFLAGLYILFAFSWIMNFVPILQLASIFFIFPVLYNAMITMIKE